MTVTTLESTTNKERQVCYATLSSIHQPFVLGNSKLLLAESLPTLNCAIPRNKNLSDYAHLRDVSIIELPEWKRVSLIIGTNEASAHVPSEVRRGSRFEPQALQTPFGWTIISSGSSNGQCAYIQRDEEIRDKETDQLTASSVAMKTKKGLKHGLNHSTDKVYKLKSRKTMARFFCQPSQTITKDFNLSKIESEDSATREKEETSMRGWPPMKQRGWVCPFTLQNLQLLLLFIPLLVLSLSPVASSMERESRVTFQPTLPEKAQHFEANQRVVQHSTDVFCIIWQKEYLQTFQRRCKWHIPQSNIAVGDVVLLIDRRFH
jgi:hypothetical protein